MAKIRRGERFAPSVALGEAIRARRIELGFSQESLATESGLDRTYVGGLERGERNPTLRVLWKMSSALSLQPSELLRIAEDGL